MALLLDLPAAARSTLAATWRCAPDPASLFRQMTQTDAIARVLRDASASARQALGLAARAPTTILDMETRLPFSYDTIVRDVAWLGDRGLLIEAPDRIAHAPRRARAVDPSRTIYVAAEIADALPSDGI